MAIIDSGKTTHSSGSRLSSEFVLVPRVNFVGSVAPEWVKEWIVPEEELRANYEVPYDSDFSAFFVCDGGVPKSGLGKRLKKISFEEQISRVIKAKDAYDSDPDQPLDQGSAAAAPALAAGPSAAGAPASTGGPSAAAAPAAPQAPAAKAWAGASAAPGPSAAKAPGAPASAANAPGAPASAANAPGTPASAAKAPEHLGAAVGEPASKKQRVLKMLQSEEAVVPPDEMEAATLEDLITKIKKAARAKQIYSPDLSNATTVHFWSSQVVGALKASFDVHPDSAAVSPGASAGAAPGSPAAKAPGASAASAPGVPAASAPETKANLIKKHFAGFLLKLLYANKVYRDLHHFIPILEALVKYGCESPGDLSALKQFAQTNLGSIDAPEFDMSKGDLAARVTFYGSPLYKDFIQCRAEALLSEATTTIDRQLRASCLEALGKMGSMDDISEWLGRQIKWGRTLFGKTTDQSRLLFALGAPEQVDRIARIEFAVDWAEVPGEQLDWPTLAVFAQPVPVPVGVSWDSFAKTTELVAAAGLRKYVANPLVGAFMDFKVEARAQWWAQPGPAFHDALVMVVAKFKLQATHWTALPDDIDFKLIEPAHLQSLSKSLGRLWPSKPPLWVQLLRDRAKKEAEEQAAASAAAAPGALAAGADPAGGAPGAVASDSAGAAPEVAAASAAGVAAASAAGEDAAGAAPGTPTPGGDGGGAPEVPDAGFMIGDIVRLDDSVGKRFINQEAQVTKVSPKMVTVAFINLKDKPKSVLKTACAIVQHSTLKAMRAASAAGAPGASAAVAPGPTEASSSSGSAAGAPVKHPAVDEAAYCESLFGAGDDM